MRLLSKLPLLPPHVTPLVLQHVIDHVIAQFRAQFLLLDFFAYCYDLILDDEVHQESDGNAMAVIGEEKQAQNDEIALLAVQGLFKLTYHHNLYVAHSRLLFLTC